MQHARPKSKSSTRGYQKYRCQYKHKPILTKLNNDAGYPQQILALGLSPLHSPDNYLEQNMQNLRNFFQDRIPAENTLLNKLMKREVNMVNPRRISEMKQLQYELKSKTKMPLPHSIDMVPPQKKGSVEFKKVKDRFHVNDKNRELKEMYGTKADFRHYERDNFRRGTQSHIQKRSNILKKLAYDNVFGPDPSSFSRTVVTKDSEPSSPSPRKAKSISSSAVQAQISPRRRLRELIINLSDFKNKLEQKGQSNSIVLCDQSPQVQQSQMVTLIQQMAQTYQVKSINRNVHKLEEVEDLRKINQQFYSHMLEHKEHRLSKRKEFISSTVNISMYKHETKRELGSHQTERVNLDGESEISARDQAQQVEDGLGVHQHVLLTVQQRFNLLKKTLVRWAALIFIYGIQKSDIYIAFQSKAAPYEMEGSYAFFKCIKQGDLESVRTFIRVNHCYVYDVDFHGRSAISYACYYDQTEIAREILAVGVNSDQLCNGKRTALYYALMKRNVGLVRELLQRGACPWSSPHNPYSEMLPFGENRQELSCLFNNAKKIYLGMQIQSTIQQRRLCWEKNRGRIVEDRRISYDYR